MALCTGCLYTAPVWRGEVNQDPRILEPQGDEGDVHPLPIDIPALVIASDPEDDDLVFVWDVPGYPNLAPTTRPDGGVWVSRLVLPYDPALDGQLVRVFVIDQSPQNNAVPVLFSVEVP